MFDKNVWLIGGTSESVAIAELLTNKLIPVIVTVTTTNAQNLYSENDYLKIIVGKIETENIAKFIKEHQIRVIIDASHPFAVNISTSVISIAQKYSYPYLRYERSQVKSTESNLIYVNSLSSLIDSNLLTGKRVLLTIGSNHLHFFQDYQSQATLFTRILPYTESLEKALQGGFTCDRIIAIRPPLNYELEKALWKLWQIEIVVTKAGGKQGGEDLKQKLAKESGISLIIIKRPQLNYPLVTEKIEFVLTYCSQFFS